MFGTLNNESYVVTMREHTQVKEQFRMESAVEELYLNADTLSPKCEI